MKKILILAIVFNLNVFSLIAQDNSEISIENLELINIKKYLVHKTSQSIVIDGKEDDEGWKKVKFTDEFINIEGTITPKYKTQVKMLWDTGYLYVYAKMVEEHIWADITEHDAIIFHNNDFEVFIDPDGDGRNYTEIEINAYNIIWDLMLDKPYRLGGIANDYYEIENLKTAVFINGSINDPSDVDSFWSVEMAIPMEVILLAKHKGLKYPKDKDIWKLNFSRVQWQHDIINNRYYRKKINNKLLPEMNWVWSTQGEINMHIPELWGYIQFTKSQAGSSEEFESDKDQLSKQVCYSLFRRFKFDEPNIINGKETYDAIKILNFTIQEQEFTGKLSKTESGFELKLNNITLDRLYHINNSGELIRM